MAKYIKGNKAAPQKGAHSHPILDDVPLNHTILNDPKPNKVGNGIATSSKDHRNIKSPHKPYLKDIKNHGF